MILASALVWGVCGLQHPCAL